jgi:DUF1680 family protein
VTSAAYRELALGAVSITSGFWSSWVETVRSTTLPYQLEMLRRTGRIDALRGDWSPGSGPEPHIFWDSDVAKWIEAASYSLATRNDPQLDAEVDEVIELLAAAQHDDGYLNTYFTVVAPGRRWTDLRDAHELYCAGHLIEAGVAHYEATGKARLLEVVRRYADHIAQTFGTGPGQIRGYDGHEEIELALVKLYRATGERRYLELSQYFVDERGTQPYFFELEAKTRGTVGYHGHQPPFDRREGQPERFREYNQSHLPVREQTRVVGHAVRAMYLYTAMAALAAETGDGGLRAACERLWENLAQRQMYVTGGLGASHEIEGFTLDFDLPNDSAYAETCAAIGLVFWAHRMTLLTGESRYADVLELALHNAVVSGMAQDGRRFFYGNPLESTGDVERQEWFDVACCPPNLARLLTSLGTYVYAVADDEVAVNLYVGGDARLGFGDGLVTLRQQGDLPWSGDVELEVEVEAAEVEAVRFTLALRVPAWTDRVSVLVNGSPVQAEQRSGYLRLVREWRSGDRVGLALSMPPRRLHADPRLRHDAGRVALARGPLVYCLEQVDNEVPLAALALPRQARIEVRPDAGLLTLEADGLRDDHHDWGPGLYREEPPPGTAARLVAVPYFAWNNRDKGAMQVWVREAVSGADDGAGEGTRR